MGCFHLQHVGQRLTKCLAVPGNVKQNKNDQVLNNDLQHENVNRNVIIASGGLFVGFI